MKEFNRKEMVEILKGLDTNYEGMSYDIMWDICETLRNDNHKEAAEIIDEKMQHLVTANMLNHQKTYEGIWDIYQYLIANNCQLAADILRVVLEDLKAKGLATKAELN